MEACCDLEVDVNGEETFMVDKNIVASQSDRFRKLFGKSIATKTRLKVVFNDFPGGPDCFELALKHCYNNSHGSSQIIAPFNISHLHCAAKFMEMKNLLEKTEKSFDEMRYWSWSEVLTAVRKSQSLCCVSPESSTLDRCLDCLVGRLVSSPAATEPSPCPSTSSQESSGLRFSFDTKSTESSKTVFFSRTTWWFEDLLLLKPFAVEALVKSMLARKFDHSLISKFLFYYHKSKLQSVESAEKFRVTETVVNLLCTLDRSSVPCKSLFEISRVGLGSKTSKIIRNKLENIIGSALDQATLDNLLVPSHGTDYLYDVNLVLRLVKAFLRGQSGDKTSMIGLKKVSSLLDSYIAEVAPDPYLKPSKFLSLIMALPESARDSYDEIYRAIDMYLEVHNGLSEEEKMMICYAMNYKKLSSETCLSLSRNKKFPSKSATQALVSQQFRLKSLLKSTNTEKSSHESPCLDSEKADKNQPKKEEQVVLYAGELDLEHDDNTSLRSHLQGMQWRVMELEKVCKKMQLQMAKIMKSRATTTNSNGHTRSLPRLCS